MGSFCGASPQSVITSPTNPGVQNQQNNVYNAANATAASFASDPTKLVADITPTQQNLINYESTLPGGSVPWVTQAEGTIGGATPYYGQGAGALGAAQGTYGAASGYTGTGAAPTALQGFNPQPYMNPYTQNVIDTTMANAQRNDAIAQNGALGNAIAHGNAFGGDRAGLAMAELARNQSLSRDQTIAGLENQNYVQASGQSNTQQQLDLNNQQNNAARALQAGQVTNATASGLTGIGSGYAGLGTAQTNTGATYGNLADQSATTQANTAATALQGATQDQQTNQQKAIAPWTNVGLLTANSPGTNAVPTTTTYPGANPAGTILGAGIAGLGAAKTFGLFDNTNSPQQTSDTNPLSSNIPVPNFANGGRIGFDNGGSVMPSDHGPMETFKDSLDGQDKMGGFAYPPPVAAAPAAPASGQSGGGASTAGTIVSAAQKFLPLLFLKNGGVARAEKASGGEVIDLDPILVGHMPQVAGTPIDPFRKGYWGAGEVTDDTASAGGAQERADAVDPMLGWDKMGPPDWLLKQQADAKAGVGAWAPENRYKGDGEPDKVARFLGEMTGVPSMVRGTSGMLQGYNEGDLAKGASGAAEALIGALPASSMTRAGSAMIKPFYASVPRMLASGAVLGGMAGYSDEAHAAQNGLDAAVVSDPVAGALRKEINDLNAERLRSAKAPIPGLNSPASDAARGRADAALDKQITELSKRLANREADVKGSYLENAPFRERYPGVAPALVGVGLGAAAGIPFVSRFAKTVGDRYWRGPAIDAAAETAAAAFKTGTAAEQAAAQDVLRSKIQNYQAGQSSLGKTVGGALLGGAMSSEMASAPEQIDAISFSPGHPTREAAMQAMHSPDYWRDRAILGLTGVAASKIGGLVGTGAGVMATPRSFGTPDLDVAREIASRGNPPSMMQRAKERLGFGPAFGPSEEALDRVGKYQSAVAKAESKVNNARDAQRLGGEAQQLESTAVPSATPSADASALQASQPRLVDRIREGQDAMPPYRQIGKPTDAPMGDRGSGPPPTYIPDNPRSSAVADALAAQKLSAPKDPVKSQMPEDASKRLEMALGVPEGYTVPSTHAWDEKLGQPRNLSNGQFDSHDVLVPVAKNTGKSSTKSKEKLDQDGKPTDPNDPSYWEGKNTRGMFTGGSIPAYANGGSTSYADVSRDPIITGAVIGHTGGREDALPVSVPSGSFVIPSDVVSGLGTGNTLAGVKALERMFGKSTPQTSLANGGKATPIKISDGEFVLSPEQVTRVGHGDMDRGHRTLDKMVVALRKEHIKTLKGLPGPSR